MLTAKFCAGSCAIGSTVDVEKTNLCRDGSKGGDGDLRSAAKAYGRLTPAGVFVASAHVTHSEIDSNARLAALLRRKKLRSRLHLPVLDAPGKIPRFRALDRMSFKRGDPFRTGDTPGIEPLGSVRRPDCGQGRREAGQADAAGAQGATRRLKAETKYRLPFVGMGECVHQRADGGVDVSRPLEATD